MIRTLSILALGLGFFCSVNCAPTAYSEYTTAVADLDLSAVKEDIKAALTDSKDSWPADYGNYGGLMIRLAWHCAGSYRRSDGRGGCDGGRIRFAPEGEWPDNANLDKALELLKPIKDKHGLGLSWGDLIVLTGTTAIESMGGPVLGFCAGRFDDEDGSKSLLLGPSEEQEKMFPCPNDGACAEPLGPTTMGLIYVNPEGPKQEPDPAKSADDVRSSFGRMDMDDRETVALVGGGHAFGKTHGACDSAPCGSGMGADTFTSGFEGPWTSNPTGWDNQYFQLILNQEWEKHTGPGGHWQWQPKMADGETAPSAPGPADSSATQTLMMLTADLALVADDKYKEIVTEFANDQSALDEAFKNAWYKLMTRDMGPVTRCLNSDVPAAQDWQNPLSVSEDLPDMEEVKTAIKENMGENGEKMIELAFQCASTYRITDHLGGCNGARVRFSPQKDWAGAAMVDEAMAALTPIKDQFPSLSWADLIVLSGNTALEAAGAPAQKFCGGRGDAEDGSGTIEQLKPIASTGWGEVLEFKERAERAGLTLGELSALESRAQATKDTPSFAALESLDLDEVKEKAAAWASDKDAFLQQLGSAWYKLMNADHYGSECLTAASTEAGPTDETEEPGPDEPEDEPDAGLPYGAASVNGPMAVSVALTVLAAIHQF